MTDTAPLFASEPLSTTGAGPFTDVTPLRVTVFDIFVALVTFVLSLGVFWCAITATAPFPLAMMLHLEVLGIPALFVLGRLRNSGDLTIPMLLLVATGASGPIGAAGCAATALALWWQRSSPQRLHDWYEYIAGTVERGRLTQLHDDLAAGRLPAETAAKVPRFSPILAGSATDDQQQVLAVVGRRYHDEFRPILKRALRNRNGLIRTQAAAIASQLSGDEKSRLWATEPAPVPAARGANRGLRLIERNER
jgi:hypothetical protein